MSLSIASCAVLLFLPPLSLRADAPSTRPAPAICWDLSTLRLIEKGGDYGRMVRLGDGRVVCVYDCDRKMWIRHSADDGVTWTDPVLVAAEPECWLTNADLLPLNEGTLLYFWCERPLAALPRRGRPASRPLTRPFLIRMSRSTDLGRTWSEPRTLYTAGTAFGDGCWEPAAIQLASGDVHVYFANESPFRDSAEQEISLMRSRDGGRTWSDAERIVFRRSHRDGMPVPLVLADGRGIVVAIEDDGYAGGRFKPVIVHTPLDDCWRSGAVEGDSSRRWGALAEPLPDEWYGGAPFLRQLPSGETLLSYQESADGGLERCRMAVCIGDAHARAFTARTYPFPPGPTGSQLWNSLFVKNASTITAISSTTVNGIRGIWAIDGHLPPAR